MARAPAFPDERAVWDERVKLTANAMNNIAVATVVTGTLVPLISGLCGTTSAFGWFRLALFLFWLVLGISMHLGALTLLGRIRG